jgi:hypothetical protein
MLKAVLDSALGLNPDDKSPEARAARTVPLKKFDGINFMGKIGIEKGGSRKEGGNFPDRNVLADVVTKDKKGWSGPIEQPPPFNGGGGDGVAGGGAAAPTSTSAAPVSRPGWAQ